MLIVHVDQIARGGAPLEVHPRLTIVRGLGPEGRRRLRRAVRALAGDGAPDGGGVIEISGVRLSLDEGTIAQLGLVDGLDPVLVLDGAGTPRRPAGSPVDDDGGAPGRARSGVPARQALREVTAQRSALGARMDEARSRLDPFSTSALDVCVGQIDALDARRSMYRAEWEQRRAELERERRRRDRDLRVVAELIRRVRSLPVERVGEAADRLRSAVSAPTADDVSELAEALVAALVACGESASERRELERRRAGLASRLEALLADRRGGADVHPDADAVRRLEAVRDEILAASEPSVLSGHSRKRRVAELRAEEALLLDRLGFDTYSAYLMGMPSEDAREQRRRRREALDAEIDHVRGELAELDARMTAQGRPAHLTRVLGELAARAALLVGADATGSRRAAVEVGDDGPASAGSERIEALVAELHRLSADPRRSDELRDAVISVRSLVADSVSGWPEEPVPPGAGEALPPPPGPPFRALPDVEDPEELLRLVALWDTWAADMRAWADRVGSLHGDAPEDTRRSAADAGGGGDDPTSTPPAELIAIESELSAAADRLERARERVARHEEATAELAELRLIELDLRDQERDLLEAVARAGDAGVDAPAVVEGPGGPVAPDGVIEVELARERPAGPSRDEPSEPPEPDAPDAPAEPAEPGEPAGRGEPDDPEWALIARCAAQRRVSFVGSVPLLVEGLPSDDRDRAAVLERIRRLSDLVQVIVLSDDAAVLDWARDLGAGAAVVAI